MFEKPQYLTRDGYRRKAVNQLGRQRIAPQAANAANPRMTLSLPSKGIKLSPQAAKLIANAIKVMLKS